MERSADPARRLLDWIWFRAIPAFSRWLMRLPKPIRVPVAITSVLGVLTLFLALMAFGAFGWLFGYRPQRW
jgi:hypothetical protein